MTEVARALPELGWGWGLQRQWLGVGGGARCPGLAQDLQGHLRGSRYRRHSHTAHSGCWQRWSLGRGREPVS